MKIAKRIIEIILMGLVALGEFYFLWNAKSTLEAVIIILFISATILLYLSWKLKDCFKEDYGYGINPLFLPGALLAIIGLICLFFATHGFQVS